MKPTTYDTITNQIVAAIEEGAGPYQMPWHRARHDISSPLNAASGRSYRGLNIITLWMKQWQERGAQVRKGEKSASVFFWKNLNEGKEGEATGDEERGARFVARAYSVFNAEQVDGYEAPDIPALDESERVARAEVYFASIPAQIESGGDRACYIPAEDRVRMVPFARFRDACGYYATLAHELTHWTGAKARLDRDLSSRFGSEGYAMEELVAELGAAFIAGQLSLPSEPRRDHAPYIASWLKVLKNDARAVFTAATKAQAAADYLGAFSTAPHC